MGKQILTLDNLYQFYLQKNETVAFSSKDSGKPIVVTTNGFFETEEDDMPGMLKLKLKVCHTQKNRNGSHISTENMQKAMPTLKYRPILAYIHELKDGTKDFYAHNINIIERDDGEEEVVYLEKQVGCFTADDPWLEYDKDMDKTYVMAYGVIPEIYTDASEIIKRKNGTKVSCELVINELSYNAKEKYLDLIDFYFGGTTLLGCDEDGNEIGEGMLGARADISDFCHNEPKFTYEEKMIEVLDKLNTTLSNFNKDTTQKGGNEMSKFEELLVKYNKTVEDISFEYENMSDEELEAKFAELFDDNGESAEGTSSSDDQTTLTSGSEGDNTDGQNDDTGSTDGNSDKYELKYELSHDDIRRALYELIQAQHEEDGYWYSWIAEVYDDKFIYEDYNDMKFYRQKYIKDGDTVALDGEPIEVFSEWLSKEEKDALEALKAGYASLKSFKEQYDASVVKAEKDAVFASPEYAEVRETDAFKALMAECDKYTVDELKVKCDLLFAAHIKAVGSFSIQTPCENKNTHTIGIDLNSKPTKKKPYGKLFDDNM